ncbi:MAG: twin-arginine translocase TatA/TatE family subunit [Myxococcales bacterium]|nr:twin-arginine translocase TatA/TatE family subunit [Myxococcales bacterium]
MGLGVQELLLILAIVLVIFGANKLPGIGKAFGKAIRGFKQSAAGDDEIEVNKQAASGDARRDELPAGIDAQDAEIIRGRKKDPVQRG